MKITFISIVLLAILLAPAAYAEDSKPTTIPCIPSLPCVTKDTQEKGGGAVRNFVQNTFASTFLISFIGVSGATAVIFIIVGGIQMRMSMGNEEAIGKAKKTILWAIVGLVLVILSAAIISIVTNIFR